MLNEVVQCCGVVRERERFYGGHTCACASPNAVVVSSLLPLERLETEQQ